MGYPNTSEIKLFPFAPETCSTCSIPCHNRGHHYSYSYKNKKLRTIIYDSSPSFPSLPASLSKQPASQKPARAVTHISRCVQALPHCWENGTLFRCYLKMPHMSSASSFCCYSISNFSQAFGVWFGQT